MPIKTLATLVVLSAAAWAGQSIVLPPGAAASNAGIPAQTGDCRGELLLQNWPGSPSSEVLNYGNACGFFIGFQSSPDRLQIYWEQGNAGSGPCVGEPFIISLTGFALPALYLRFQKSTVTKMATVEAWDANGTRVFPYTGGSRQQASGVCTYTALSGSPGPGLRLGSSLTQFSAGFFRIYSTLVPIGSQMPLTAASGAAAGCVFEWKFDGNGNDACGTYPAAISGAASYAPTGPIQNLVSARARTLDAPVYADWRAMRAGSANALDGTQSFSQVDATGAVSYYWTHVSGPSVPVYNDQTAARPMLTNIVRGTYVERLQVTDAVGNKSTADLQVGAVAMDRNGVILPATQDEGDFWGPQIAFGYNPWGLADERQYKMVGLQAAYQPQAHDFGWATAGQGTVSYWFAGRGPAPSTVPGTILTAAITASSATLQIADAAQLPGLQNLPGWILISAGGYAPQPEMVRICGTTATSGPATLTVCYDGRGMSGNRTDLGGTVNILSAQSWSAGSVVGEFRIDGAGTRFASDAQRAICPAGVPGPPGPVVYTAGTVSLTAGSKTVVGTGTAWSAGTGSDSLGKGWIRVSATHDGGTPFVYWAQITGVVDATHLTVDRPAPAGVDGAAFGYQITGHAMYLSLEFPAPHGETARGLWQAVGCETETSMYALPSHDTAAMNGVRVSGAKYSYKKFLSELSSSGTYDPNFYGAGLAARNFYYRSGYQPALDLANSIDENWVRDPQVGDGLFVGAPLTWGGGAIGAVADLMFNPSTALTWANVESFADQGDISGRSCNALDTRDSGYLAAMLTLAANYDSNPAMRSGYQGMLKNVLSRDQTCKRNAADGYTGMFVNSFANAFTYGPADAGLTAPLTLAGGSANVTGSGFTSSYCYGVDTVMISFTHNSSTATVGSGTLTQQNLLWIWDGTSTRALEYAVNGNSVQLAELWPGPTGSYAAMSTGGGALTSGGQRSGGYGGILITGAALGSGQAPDTLAVNQALQEAYACKYNSPNSLTLHRPSPVSGTGYLSYYNIPPFSQQPFMLGVKTNQMRWASRSGDPDIRSGYASLLPLAGAWYNAYGWDSNGTLGTFYAVAPVCGSSSDVAAGQFASIHGYQGCGTTGNAASSAAVGRVNSAEGGSAMLQFYLANPTPANQAVVDRFYGAIFGDPAFCRGGVYCDGTSASQLADTYMSGSKWPGFFFGMGGFFTTSWPAIRQRQGATASVVLQ